ncbi:MAG: 3'(2'),5'-bisphosphate nucleotidase [Gammaproteobacteria bacterium]|nr:3'(2'),5'-bisphosphate nucleotidase [Gammaproteobacteria bacterium]
MELPEQLRQMQQIASSAGKEILSVYEDSRPIDVTVKADNSPLTEADRRAHSVIVEQLAALPEKYPILSEESDAVSFQQRSGWETYWLVDPLDGTKEFISRNGEFTVNIALVESGIARAGVVHVPLSGDSYIGELGQGAWKLAGDESPQPLLPTSLDSKSQHLRIVASRNHRGPDVDRIIMALEQDFEAVEVVSMGSSLKFCLLAEGKADVYPRLAPTSEWDTAAAHAVLRAAGGDVVTTQFVPLRYNQKSGLLNPFFIAVADASFDWRTRLAPVLTD